MQEMNDNTVLEKQQKDISRMHKQEDRVKESSSVQDNVIRVIENVKETSGEFPLMDETVVTFLHEKNLVSETLINTSLADQRVRLLKTRNLSDDDINLQDLWLRLTKVKVNRSSESVDSTSDGSSSNASAQLSPNSIYLKEVLSKPLIQALCEIVAKKPADPVEYLGHWLLHYKICEERAIQQRERETKLPISREKLELQKIEDKDFFVERKDEEEHGEDWNYFDYNEL
ncbi:uncharacterized protein LOC105201330 isoform X2 [Solenopsis invicta]|nr:uncharacterized protein LOC105201330 isoform X2 [Solenopsis invicta]